jgi:hypothetical protein
MTDGIPPHVSADVRARHAEMMASSGATGNPEDYRARLSYVLPFRAPGPKLLLFCGCCQGPMDLLPEIGAGVSWQRRGGMAALCAVCLEVLRRTASPGAAPVHVPRGYDVIGFRYATAFPEVEPAELAQRRMAEIEGNFARVLQGVAGVNAADVARQAHLESAGTLRGLTRIWQAQRPHRLKIGDRILRLQGLGTPAALAELDGIVADIPGAMQAAGEASSREASLVN